MHERRGLQSMVAPFAGEVTSCQPSQLSIYERHQFLQRAAVAVASVFQNLSHIVCGGTPHRPPMLASCWRNGEVILAENVRFGPVFSALLIEKDEYENKSAVQIGDCRIDVVQYCSACTAGERAGCGGYIPSTSGDNIAYMTVYAGADFGTIDLATGAFTRLGNSGQPSRVGRGEQHAVRHLLSHQPGQPLHCKSGERRSYPRWLIGHIL